jgi:hypothetical protein
MLREAGLELPRRIPYAIAYDSESGWSVSSERSDKPPQNQSPHWSLIPKSNPFHFDKTLLTQIDIAAKRLQRALRIASHDPVSERARPAARVKGPGTTRRSASRRKPASPVAGPPVTLGGRGECPIVRGKRKNPLTVAQYDVVKALLDAGETGLTKDTLDSKSKHSDARKVLRRLADSDADWNAVIQFGRRAGGRYRIR